MPFATNRALTFLQLVFELADQSIPVATVHRALQLSKLVFEFSDGEIFLRNFRSCTHFDEKNDHIDYF